MSAEDPEVVEGWQESLERFDRTIWPLFRTRGYTKDSAYLYWTLNRLINTLEELPALMRPPDDNDGDTWKR